MLRVTLDTCKKGKSITQTKKKILTNSVFCCSSYVESNSLTTLVKIPSAGHGAWKEGVDDRRSEGSRHILDHPDSIPGYPDDPDELEHELEDVLEDELEYDLKVILMMILETLQRRCYCGVAVTQLDYALGSLNIQESEPSPN